MFLSQGFPAFPELGTVIGHIRVSASVHLPDIVQLFPVAAFSLVAVGLFRHATRFHLSRDFLAIPSSVFPAGKKSNSIKTDLKIVSEMFTDQTGKNKAIKKS